MTEARDNIPSEAPPFGRTITEQEGTIKRVGRPHDSTKTTLSSPMCQYDRISVPSGSPAPSPDLSQISDRPSDKKQDLGIFETKPLALDVWLSELAKAANSCTRHKYYDRRDFSVTSARLSDDRADTLILTLNGFHAPAGSSFYPMKPCLSAEDYNIVSDWEGQGRQEMLGVASYSSDCTLHTNPMCGIISRDAAKEGVTGSNDSVRWRAESGCQTVAGLGRLHITIKASNAASGAATP